MAITQSGHGLWLVRCLVAALLPLAAETVAPAQDGVESRVIRGQSPTGYFRKPQRYSQSVPSDPVLPFTAAPSPWILVSQDMEAPSQTFSAEPPNTMNQQPYDPRYQQPFPGGVPGYVDPSLALAFINTPPIWQPYVGVQGNLGNDRSMGFGQLMIPLYQDGQSLIFADLRGRFDDSSNSEGNFGLAMRTIVDPTWIFGLYGFYDYKRSEFGNSFQQATIGMEALSIAYEARVNGYIPESGAKRANQITEAQFDNGTIFVRGGFERAYYGVDAEVGALLAEQYGGSVELRGFVGGYYFDTAASGFPSVAGPKGRLEWRAYDVPWFGPESRLTFGIELQHDRVRDTQVAGLARLEIPLGMFAGARRLNRLERRMLDRIVRDDDVITVAQKSPREVGRDSLTGQLLNNVIRVHALTSDVNAAVAAAAAVPTSGPPALNGSTVVVDGSLGPIASNKIVVQEGQVFRGGGFHVIGSSDTGAITTFGTRPTINNPDKTVPTVILSDNTTVADLNLTGGEMGISGTDLTGVRVSGNQVSGAEIFGIGFNGTLTNSTVSGNTANNNGLAGIGIEHMAAGSTVTGNTANNNGEFGILIGTLSGGTVSGNTANNNGFAGIGIFEMSGGIVSRNMVNNNDFAGIGILDISGGTVSRNKANNNFGFGLDFGSGSNPILGMLSDNFSNNNALGGYLFNGPIVGTVTGNSATANGFSSNASVNDPIANGFSLIFPNFGTFTNNTATGNANNGFAAGGDDPFTNDVGGTFSFNTANQNGGQGYLGTSLLGSTAESNAGSFNAGGGDSFIFP